MRIMVHVDVMDHHFRPESDHWASRLSSAYLRGHRSAGRRASDDRGPGPLGSRLCGAWAPHPVSFHMGATHAPVRLARQLREMGCEAWFAVRPAEPVEPIFDILEEFDTILIMTVEPGFGGQKFLANQMGKVRRLRDEITRRGLATKIQVDGGVSPKTAAHRGRGRRRRILVAGSAVYGAADPAEGDQRDSRHGRRRLPRLIRNLPHVETACGTFMPIPRATLGRTCTFDYGIP